MTNQNTTAAIYLLHACCSHTLTAALYVQHDWRIDATAAFIRFMQLLQSYADSGVVCAT